MDIHSLCVERAGEAAERISATVFGAKVFYHVTGAPSPLARSYDPFVLAGFAKAMEEGEVLTVDGDAPVSAPLLTNLQRAMGVYAQWSLGLSPVPIHAGAAEPAREPNAGLVGCFFSGGVDSIYSVIRNEEEITHLILCRGLDIPFHEEARWQTMADMARKFAAERRKKLVLVETNAKELLQRPVETDNHGAVLVSTALALRLQRLILPASDTLRLLIPWGSHPMLDPHFSNGVTEVVHDSLEVRTTKIRTMVGTGIGLDCLRVCNVFTREVNCGECEKCLRTRVVLTLLGGESPHLPPLEDPKILRSVKLGGDGYLNAWTTALFLAKEVGRKDFQREIEGVVRRYRIRRAVRQLDEDLLGGLLLKAKRLVRPPRKRGRKKIA